jgi:hypothetical protein
MRSSAGQTIIQLRVTLEEVEPLVWRRLLVPGNAKLAKLHDMVQVAMGWTNSHLHQFMIGNAVYGMHADDYPEHEIDYQEVTILDAVGTHERFSYEYDFGDGWEHEIVVETSTPTPHGLKHAVCLAGENACPPEDCGGPGGYEELLQVLGDPAHEDHDQLTEWIGGSFDPAFFDLVAVNVALQQLR